MVSYPNGVNGHDVTNCASKVKSNDTRRNPKPRCGGKNCDLSISVEEERPCVYCPGNYNAVLEHVFKGFLDLEQCPTFEFFFPVCHKFDHAVD